jgi:hypothetical protein
MPNHGRALKIHLFYMNYYVFKERKKIIHMLLTHLCRINLFNCIAE